MARLTRPRVISVSIVAAIAGLGLSACGSGVALSQARQACTKVERSITIYKKAVDPSTSPAAAVTLTAQAQSMLLSALPYAAAATSSDGSFNSLMTTIQEADRVPEDLLIDSLKRQCDTVFSNTPYLGS